MRGHPGGLAPRVRPMTAAEAAALNASGRPTLWIPDHDDRPEPGGDRAA